MQSFTKVTWFNRVGLLILAIGIPYLVMSGQPFAAGLWLIALAYLGFSVRRSITARADDQERVSAAQPYDERDSAAMTRAFALVGQFAFLAQVAIIIWHMGRPDEPGLLVEALKTVALAVVLGIGNRTALRRV